MGHAFEVIGFRQNNPQRGQLFLNRLQIEVFGIDQHPIVIEEQMSVGHAEFLP